MSDKLRNKLKHCPFCGDKGSQDFYWGDNPGPGLYVRVFCEKCCAQGPRIDAEDHQHGTQKERERICKAFAMNAWNERRMVPNI